MDEEQSQFSTDDATNKTSQWNENLKERSLAEPDDIFCPPRASTPRLQQHQDSLNQRQHGDSAMAGEQNISQARSLASTSAFLKKVKIRHAPAASFVGSQQVILKLEWPTI